ncbi:haloacid dehalogenase [Porphyromonas gingivalis]|uniref:HAD family hydrolase n=1 Tax=Porphyromonas gingivalis TaxID=837 RepID=UPI000974FE00|nr:HAD family hydrolase [Porphyromonas gingivalis]SJL28898.1 haloacid dehalogenase [Porphyromonas gingivalis]
MEKKESMDYNSITEALQAFRTEKAYRHAPLRSCFFDMDGVLFDSMPAHARSWVEAAGECGIAAEPLDFYRWEGQKGSDTIKILFERGYGRLPTEKEIADMYGRKSQLFALYNSGNVIDDAPALVSDVCDRGLRIMLVTGSSQTDILQRLQRSYGDNFSPANMVTGADVHCGKPHPEPYLKALECVGMSPSEAFVVENAPLGVRAAVDAGIFTIAVNTGCLPDADLWDAGASLVLPSMAVLRSLLGELLTESLSSSA